MKSSNDIRTSFLEYFRERGHQVVPSSSLVPGNDSTLLFTNAGMVQFKDAFLGDVDLGYTRAASSQRCVRAGGKHNDLENVGYTARHHTFFEMLGNFSFGDYFKREAIQYAWEYLTEVAGLPVERLWVTIFEEDDEAADIWLNEIGVSPERFSRIGAKDNFWSMGDTGPCGPCTEIFYDHGQEIPGGPPGTPEEDGDRYVEIWNLVFTQYDRDKSGALHKLPKPSVDTGMGLERLAAVLQNVHSNYQIDLFENLRTAIKSMLDSVDDSNPSLNVIADHIRSCSFLITDGVLPSNEGRGYVLRRIIRRAVRHGHGLGLSEPFFYQLVEPLVKEMADAYPELARAQPQVEAALKQEEIRFAETLDQGMRILEEDIKSITDQVIPGETVFKLYDTYGFPVDLTADIARERGLTLDMSGFETHMQAQRERARAASQFGTGNQARIEIEGTSEFTGYDRLEGDATIISLIAADKTVKVLNTGEQGIVILDGTPFYAESGGQVGDTGILTTGHARFVVSDTLKKGDVHLHLGKLESGSLSVGETIHAKVDGARRQAIVLNHSATHLLHAALREELGDHVQQKGSLVAPDRLRFDFSHTEPVSRQSLSRIEERINQQIRSNVEASAEEMSMDEAMQAGAMALFGEKYGERVRVLRIGDYSTELCGGTHVRRAGDIGMLRIVSESGVAAGVRRIEALTGDSALEWIHQNETRLDHISNLLKSSREEVDAKVEQILDKNRELERELNQLKAKLASQAGADLSSQAISVGGIKVLAAQIEGADAKSLRTTLDQLKDKLGSAAIVLAAVNDKKISLIAGVTKDQTKRIKAGDLVNSVAQQVGGKGGGRPDMAQAGGNNPAALPDALSGVQDWVRSQLQ